MIFSEAQTLDADDIFNGWGRGDDPDFWNSLLPALSTVTFFQSADPAFAGTFSLDSSSDEMRELAQKSVVSGMRNCITKISRSWGYYTSAAHDVKAIFKDSLQTVSEVIDGVSSAMEAVEIAVNSIAWIPIVGWIIKIIYEVVNLIGKIVTSIKRRQDSRKKIALAELAAEYALPMASWTPEADTLMGRMLQKKLRPGAFDLEWAFMPRYPATRVDDFVAQRQRYETKEACTDAWLLWSDVEKPSNIDHASRPGLGFVPGTMNIHGAMSLPTSGGGWVQDYGGFFPITQTLATNVWGQTVKGDSGMTFAVDTEKVSQAWINYVSSAFHFGSEKLGGWSMVRGGIDQSLPLSAAGASRLKFNCGECDVGRFGCTDRIAGKKKSSRWMRPTGTGHRSSYLSYLHEMFQWQGNDDDRWNTITPVEALRSLREIQEAQVRSMKCMYLDDSTSADGSGNPRFKAIKRGGELHRSWVRSVTAMFESGDWKRIDYRNVIPGEEIDAQIKSLLAQSGTTPDRYFNLDSRHRPGLAAVLASGPTVLGDPKVPTPPPLNQVPTALSAGGSMKLRQLMGKGGGTSTSKTSSNAPLLLGAAAAAFFMMRGRGSRK